MAVTSLSAAAPPAANKYGIMFAGVLGMIALIMASIVARPASPILIPMPQNLAKVNENSTGPSSATHVSSCDCCDDENASIAFSIGNAPLTAV